MNKFKPFIARSNCCDTLLMLLRPRAYVTCKCGKTAVDAGDGLYYRMNVEGGVRVPTFYSQKKKGDKVMVPNKRIGH